MRFLVTLLALLSLVGPAEALDIRRSGVTMVVAGTCVTLTPSTGLGAVTIATCQDLSTTGNPTFASETLNGTLTLVNGVTAQEAILYNTFTDASNYERARIGWVETANELTISSGRLGTGSGRSLTLATPSAGGNINLTFGGTANAWQFLASTNSLVPTAADNSFDVGSSAKRVRTMYLGTSLFIGGTAFSSLPADANGTLRHCSDCDPPTLVDSTCTSAGAKTGSLAFRVNGVWKCIS